MSFEEKADGIKTSHQSGDEHDITSTDFGPAGSEDAGSMIAEPDNDNYQDLHCAEIDSATPDVGGDIAHESLDVGVSSSDEILGTDPIPELDKNDHERYDADGGSAQPLVTLNFSNMGTVFSDEDPHIDPVLNIG